MPVVAFRNINAAQRSNITLGHANAVISSHQPCQDHARRAPAGRARGACPSSAHVPRLCAPALRHPGGVGWEPCSLCNPEVPKCREQEPGGQGADCSATMAPALCQARVAAVPQEPAKGCCLGSRGVRGGGHSPRLGKIALTGSSPSGQGAAQAGRVCMGQ